MKEQIEFFEFLEIEKKLDIKIGTIRAVERIPKSSKLLKLTVNFGDDNVKTVVTNIGDKVTDPENGLLFLQFPFIVNLKPVSLMGVMSEAMIMIVENTEGKFEFMTHRPFTDGSKLL